MTYSNFSRHLLILTIAGVITTACVCLPLYYDWPVTSYRTTNTQQLDDGTVVRASYGVQWLIGESCHIVLSRPTRSLQFDEDGNVIQQKNRLIIQDKSHYGLPLRCASRSYVVYETESAYLHLENGSSNLSTLRTKLPLRGLPQINVLNAFLSLIFWQAIVYGMERALHYSQRTRRRKRQQCKQCNYKICAQMTICPECGSRV